MNFYTDISTFCVISGVVGCSVLFLYIRRGHRESMRIMEAVWPLTVLWSHWIGIITYFNFSTKKAASMNSKMKMDMPIKMGMGESKPMWQRIAVSTLHCGAGCSLADFIGEWFTFFVPFSIFGSWVVGQWILDYLLALIIGIYFQYAAIQPMEHLSQGQAIVKAFKIDFFSLTSWQLGMYGWMAIAIWGIYDGILPEKTTFQFWFLMQIAMLCGFITAYPTNKLLIKVGIKTCYVNRMLEAA